MTAALIRRNIDLEQFNYIVSHNVRSHVANISGICEILNSNIVAADIRDIFWQQLCTSVINLDSVLKDLNTILQLKKEVNEMHESGVAVKNCKRHQRKHRLPHTDTETVIHTDFEEVKYDIHISQLSL